jgi:hypothetical protein
MIAILFAVLIRLYYFLLTKSQPLWWDESEYMSQAKAFAGIIDLKTHWGSRLPGFPLTASIFFIFSYYYTSFFYIYKILFL